MAAIGMMHRPIPFVSRQQPALLRARQVKGARDGRQPDHHLETPHALVWRMAGRDRRAAFRSQRTLRNRHPLWQHVKRTITATTPSVIYSAADQVTILAAQSAVSIAVYQINAVIGRGHPKQAII
jgi:hypothetical protein